MRIIDSSNFSSGIIAFMRCKDSTRLDLLVVATTFAATYLIAYQLKSAYAGIYALLVCLAASTWRLAAAGSSWRDLGLHRPHSWLRTLLWSGVLLIATELVGFLALGPLGRAAHWPPLDLSRFAGLRGNWLALIGWLLVTWTSAAVAEELVFRAFLISHLQKLLGTKPVGITLTVLLQALFFGLAHFYLGQRGIATATTAGLLYGAAYLGTGRNLLVLMLAHGTTDSLSLIALYTGMMK